MANLPPNVYTICISRISLPSFTQASLAARLVGFVFVEQQPWRACLALACHISAGQLRIGLRIDAQFAERKPERDDKAHHDMLEIDQEK